MSDKDNKPQDKPNPPKPPGQSSDDRPKDERPAPPPTGDTVKRNNDDIEIKKR